MPDQYKPQHPRISTWMFKSVPAADGRLNPEALLNCQQWSSGISESRMRLQRLLIGTGLNLVGKPVIEEVDAQGNVRLSWKVETYARPKSGGEP